MSELAPRARLPINTINGFSRCVELDSDAAAGLLTFRSSVHRGDHPAIQGISTKHLCAVLIPTKHMLKRALAAPTPEDWNKAAEDIAEQTREECPSAFQPIEARLSRVAVVTRSALMAVVESDELTAETERIYRSLDIHHRQPQTSIRIAYLDERGITPFKREYLPELVERFTELQGQPLTLQPLQAISSEHWHAQSFSN